MLESRFGEVVHLAFPDHHLYTALDIQKIVTAFDNMEGEKKIVLTTEKDAQRITKWMQIEKFAALPLYGIRHEMKMFPKDAGRFETKLHGFIASH